MSQTESEKKAPTTEEQRRQREAAELAKVLGGDQLEQDAERDAKKAKECD